ncbi:MAG: CBS domain-containing protein [Leptospiraceae bacterium]|nr:CBS domain-containing protein [Leptospiraceae bacterium]
MKKVRDVMNPFPIIVDEETSLVEVFKIVEEKHLSHLLIVSGTKLVGIISKEDLLHKMLDLAKDTTGKTYNEIILETTPVHKIMTRKLHTIHPEDILDDAIRSMLDKQVHCLPVINQKNEPIGLLNPADVLKAYIAGYENVIA